MRKRGLRWLHRHGHLDDVAVHTMDSADHGGGWSVHASVTIPGWEPSRAGAVGSVLRQATIESGATGPVER